MGALDTLARGWEWYETLPLYGVLLVTVAAAFLLQFFLSKVCLFLARRTKTGLDEKVIQGIRWPLFVSLVLIGAYYALRRIEPSLQTTTLVFWKSLFTTIGIFVWMRVAMKLADFVLEHLGERADDYKWIEARTVPLFEIVTRLAIIGGAIYLILHAWKVDVTAWLASAGILGIAVGFAAKDTLANLFAGIFILADAPYKIGDFIVVDNDDRGRVTDIGIRSTRIITRDDIEIIIPNALIANSKIINESGGPHEKERIRMTVGVAYGSDTDRVREVLIDEAKKCKLVADRPAPRVRMRAFDDSSLRFQLLAWIDYPVLRGRALDVLLEGVYKRFNEEGIEIPFPQRVVTLKKEPADEPAD